MTDGDAKMLAVRRLVNHHLPSFYAEACRFAPGPDVERRTAGELKDRLADLANVQRFLKPLVDNPVADMLHAERERLDSRLEELGVARQRGSDAAKSGKEYTLELTTTNPLAPGKVVYQFNHHVPNLEGGATPDFAAFTTGMEAQAFMEGYEFMTQLTAPIP